MAEIRLTGLRKKTESMFGQRRIPAAALWILAGRRNVSTR